MGTEADVPRRTMLAQGLGLLVGLPVAAAAAKPSWDPDEGVTAPEDLMKEHGVLNRCLLIYDEGLRRLACQEPVRPEVFAHTARMIRTFVEDYHERNEEQFIFPVFRKAGRLTDLVDTLLTQHQAGRAVTAEILRLAEPKAFADAQNRARLVERVQAFLRMYRPHEAREDTVLFPALRTILSPRQVQSLGARMEEQEQQVLGHEGFERSVAEVQTIEQALGLYDLKQFTPRV